jgi:hypothetical protein
MDPHEKNDTLKHVFQVFDALETTEGFKAQIQDVITARVKSMQMKMLSQGYKDSVAKMVIQNV